MRRTKQQLKKLRRQLKEKGGVVVAKVRRKRRRLQQEPEPEEPEEPEPEE